jgi:hypothetical protein
MQPMTFIVRLVRTEATHHVVNPSNDIIFFHAGIGEVNILFDTCENLIKSI